MDFLRTDTALPHMRKNALFKRAVPVKIFISCKKFFKFKKGFSADAKKNAHRKNFEKAWLADFFRIKNDNGQAQFFQNILLGERG